MQPGEARDHPSGPRVRGEKKFRDRLAEQAAQEADGVLWFQDECWWTRLAEPDRFAWSPADPLRLCGNARDPKGGGPEAVACDGVLRQDNGGMMLRFCDGRPVSATTEDFLGWGCEILAGAGKKVFVRVWDNASWHIGRRVREWIARHDRRVYRTRQGCRIRVCGWPVEAPWLNPIEPKWMHGKRAVVEPDRKLTADELRQRVTDYYGCELHPPLPKPQP